MKLFKFSVILFLCLSLMSSKEGSYSIAVLQYNGGGDWYANPTALPNLVEFCNENLSMNIDEDVPYVEVGSPDIFNYPFLHLTGHGNVSFSASEAENLRNYMMAGGFLHISDNYGLDPYIRAQMQKVFPEKNWVELPFGHPIYHQKYDFNKGLPKIHSHDNEAPQGFAIMHEGKVVCFYDFECDLGDGWEDFEVHKDSEETRTKAFQMGANLIQYAFFAE